MVQKTFMIHEIGILFIVLLCIIQLPQPLAARTLSREQMQDAEQVLDNYIKYNLDMHHVVISFDNQVAAVAANVDETDTTTITGKIEILITLAGIAAPWTQNVHFTLYSGTSLLTYIKVPTKMVLDYINNRITDEQFFASWKLKGILIPASSDPGKRPPNTVTTTGNTDLSAVQMVPTADAYIYAYSYRNWNRSNWGGYDQLRAGRHPVGGESRMYLQFNLADIKSVSTAKLRLFHFQTTGRANVDLGIYRVSSPWREGAGTYHSGRVEKTAHPGEISWIRQPKIDPTPITSFNPGTGMRDFITVDITPLVNAWLSGTPNYGLAVKAIGNLSANTPESVYYFASKERNPNLDIPKGERKSPTLILSGTKGDSPSKNVASPDYQNALARPCADNRDFVRSLYQSILERDLDVSFAPGHGAAHLRSLEHGASRGSIVKAFFNSPEYRDKNKTERDFIRDAYQAVLGREASMHEVNRTLSEGRNAFISYLFRTAEYHRRTSGCFSSGTDVHGNDISGAWKWFDGVTMRINKDGTVRASNGGTARWKAIKKGGGIVYEIYWNNGQYVDSLMLKGNRLDGHNQNGTHVWGERIKSSIAPQLVSGTYHMQQGHWQSTWRLQVNNGSITGTSEWTCCPGHRLDPITGKVSGNSVVMERDCSGQGYNAPCRQTYQGRISEGHVTGPCKGTGLSPGDTWIMSPTP